MTLILDNITIPEQGLLEVKLNLTVEIKVTAEQARKKVNFWLMDQVNSQMGTETPVLVVGEKTVWRVPVIITFPSVGRAGTVGSVDVKVDTGELLVTPEIKSDIERLGLEIARRLPPFKLQEVPEEYKATNLPPAPPPQYVTFDEQDQPAPVQK